MHAVPNIFKTLEEWYFFLSEFPSLSVAERYSKVQSLNMDGHGRWLSSSIKIAFITLNVHFLVGILWDLWFGVFRRGWGGWTLRTVQRGTFILFTGQVLALVTGSVQTVQLILFIALRILLDDEDGDADGESPDRTIEAEFLIQPLACLQSLAH